MDPDRAYNALLCFARLEHAYFHKIADHYQAALRAGGVPWQIDPAHQANEATRYAEAMARMGNENPPGWDTVRPREVESALTEAAARLSYALEGSNMRVPDIEPVPLAPLWTPQEEQMRICDFAAVRHEEMRRFMRSVEQFLYVEKIRQSERPAPSTVGNPPTEKHGADANAEGELSLPMSLTQIANRLGNMGTHKARTFLEGKGALARCGHQQWQVRLDKLDRSTRERIEKGKLSKS